MELQQGIPSSVYTEFHIIYVLLVDIKSEVAFYSFNFKEKYCSGYTNTKSLMPIYTISQVIF